MTKAKLVVMRHGETECNKRRRMTGQRNVPLIKTGEEEAWAAGPLIRHIRFNKAYIVIPNKS
ncbi:MAG: histidine phosphatase family protein, partial [Alphaproteobacteria bacterium]|nr:histidine phosphatase family protein [Alphaproteobacteria bacterium]